MLFLIPVHWFILSPALFFILSPELGTEDVWSCEVWGVWNAVDVWSPWQPNGALQLSYEVEE